MKIRKVVQKRIRGVRKVWHPYRPIVEESTYKEFEQGVQGDATTGQLQEMIRRLHSPTLRDILLTPLCILEINPRYSDWSYDLELLALRDTIEHRGLLRPDTLVTFEHVFAMQKWIELFGQEYITYSAEKDVIEAAIRIMGILTRKLPGAGTRAYYRPSDPDGR